MSRASNVTTMIDQMTGPRVEIRRGCYLESLHAVSACVARADGRVLYALGDIEHCFPIRSLAKPFLARSFAASGALDAFRLGNIELALAAGSHDGESRHIAAVRSFLAKAKLRDRSLLCGPALEGKVVVGPPVANNCSGEHAAMLTLCRHLAVTTKDYTSPQHPVQKLAMEALFKIFKRKQVHTPLVVDGCNIPIFGASLREIAVAYARFSIADDASSIRVRDAMTCEPGYVGGWHANLDSQIITWSGGAIIAKIGAEGLHGDAAIGRGIGFAVKIHDGNSRALPPVLAQLFLRFIDDLPISRRHLEELTSPGVLNSIGRRVGEIRAPGIPHFVFARQRRARRAPRLQNT